LALLAQLALIWSYHPYYLSYYNPLLGGPKQAAKTLLVGWGEGLEQAAGYLNSKENVEELRVAVWYPHVFAPFFAGKTTGLEAHSPIIDYYVFYLNQIQRHIMPEVIDRYHGEERPEHVVSIKGIDYAWLYPNIARVSSAESPLSVNFEGRFLLIGYSFDDTQAQWGKDLGIALRWQALQESDQNYAAFLHLVDGQGHIWGQGDRWLMNDSLLPTAGWEVGDIVLNGYSLSLLKGTPPGKYRLKVGVYESESGHRLKIVGEDGASPGTEYDLGEVEVVESPLALSPADLPIQHPLEREVTGKLKLLGYGLTRDAVAFGEGFTLSLYWQALEQMEEDYTLLVQLGGEDGEVWAEGKFPLVNEYYTTSKWPVGEVVWGQYDLTVDREAPLTKGVLMINLLDSKGKPLLGENLTLTELAIEGQQAATPG